MSETNAGPRAGTGAQTPGQVVTPSVDELTCVDSRFPITEPEIVLTRLTAPVLRHKVEGAGWLAAADAARGALIEALDEADAPLDIGRPKAREIAKARGIKIGSDAIDRALRVRRAAAVTCPEPSGQVLDQPSLIPAPGSPGQVTPGDDE